MDFFNRCIPYGYAPVHLLGAPLRTPTTCHLSTTNTTYSLSLHTNKPKCTSSNTSP